jgi:hypothetical protein
MDSTLRSPLEKDQGMEALAMQHKSLGMADQCTTKWLDTTPIAVRRGGLLSS